MSWPVEVAEVVVGARFKRTWRTPAGKKRFQVREVTEIGEHLRHFEPQMNRDCCAYLVVEGWGAGREGRCARLALSQWADKVLG